MAYPNIHSLSSVAMRESATLFMTAKACALSNYIGGGVLWIGREATLQVFAVLEITLSRSSFKSKCNSQRCATRDSQTHSDASKYDLFISWFLLMSKSWQKMTTCTTESNLVLQFFCLNSEKSSFLFAWLVTTNRWQIWVLQFNWQGPCCHSLRHRKLTCHSMSINSKSLVQYHKLCV